MKSPKISLHSSPRDKGKSIGALSSDSLSSASTCLPYRRPVGEKCGVGCVGWNGGAAGGAVCRGCKNPSHSAWHVGFFGNSRNMSIVPDVPWIYPRSTNTMFHTCQKTLFEIMSRSVFDCFQESSNLPQILPPITNNCLNKCQTPDICWTSFSKKKVKRRSPIAKSISNIVLSARAI